MIEILLARWQFGITSTYHFLFVPLTLGLAFFVALMEVMYVRTGKEEYKTLTKFWGKIFVINFVMGVVTGIVQEFHFGMNWSEYSRFMGDIFGAPLALEALTAFFLESTFLGIWLFGWDRLSKKLHAACFVVVALASSLSAYWILVANSFMQNPVGYVMNNGRAEMVDFIALLTNPYVFYQYAHTVLSGLVTAGMIIIAICAYKILKKQQTEIFKTSLKFGLVWAIVGTLAVMGTGHMQAQFIHDMQPMKSAATEAIWETTDSAPFYIFANIDQENKMNKSEIGVPGAVSFMIYGKTTGEVEGINDLNNKYQAAYGEGNYIPDVTGIFWSFRIMIAAGSLILALAGLAFLLTILGRIERYPIFLKALILAIPLPYIANSCGWYITEGGRQPWIVVGLQKTANAVSPNVTSTELWITLIGFTVIYAILAGVAVYLVTKFINEDIVVKPEESTGKEATLWN